MGHTSIKREWGKWENHMGSDASSRDAVCGCFEVAVGAHGKIFTEDCTEGHNE